MKRIRKYVLFGIISVILTGLGAFAGAGYQDIQMQKEQQAVETVAIIAVVNLDEGVLQGDEVINYGVSLIDTDENSFINTGLEDARKGIQNGKYAAYIIIPATFSEKAVSLNSVPEKATIQYEVNHNLRSDIKENTLYKIFNFKNELNNNLSYMYLSSILEEFHASQDNASKVLSNDSTDMEVLQSINQMDLVTAIDIGELKQQENNIQNLDLSSDYEVNQQLIHSIQKKYDEYMALSAEELVELKEKGETASDTATIMNALNGMGAYKNEDGIYVYETGFGQILSDLGEYNTALSTNKGELKSQADKTVESLQEEANKQLNIMIGTNRQTEDGGAEDTSITGRFQVFREELKALVTRETEVELKKYVLDHISDAVTPDLITGITGDISTQIDCAIDDIEAMDPEVSLPDYISMKNDLEINSNIIFYLGAGTIDDLITETESNPDHELNLLIQELTNGEINSFLQYYDEKSSGVGFNHAADSYSAEAVKEEFKEQIKGQVREILEECVDFNNADFRAAVSTTIDNSIHTPLDILMTEGTADVLTNVFTEKIDTLDASYDEYDIGLLDRKIDLYTETASEEPTNLRTAIEKLPVVNSGGIGTVMQTGIIDTMGAITAAENQNLAVYQEQKSKEIADVQKAFQEYDPLGYINQSEINGISSDLLSNNGVIQEKFLENNVEYIEFSSGSNEVAQENVSSLVEKIQVTNDESNQRVITGLSAAKQSKETTSSVNQTLLNDFISKLPYTRLGNGPYARAYEFIIEPTEFENKATMVNTSVEEAGAVAEVADSGFLINLLIILFILTAAGFVVKRYLAGKAQRKEPVYGNE